MTPFCLKLSDPIIFLHAGGGSGKPWRGISEILIDQFRPSAPDLIGFGETSEWIGADF